MLCRSIRLKSSLITVIHYLSLLRTCVDLIIEIDVPKCRYSLETDKKESCKPMKK